MSNRLFQGVVHQMKDAIDRTIGVMDENLIRLREEISMQYRALDDIKKMAASYGFDISLPAKNAREAIQWTYFAYLGAIKEQNGAAMSLGRVSTFFDIYIERDIENGILTEEEAAAVKELYISNLQLTELQGIQYCKKYHSQQENKSKHKVKPSSCFRNIRVNFNCVNFG